MISLDTDRIIEMTWEDRTPYLHPPMNKIGHKKKVFRVKSVFIAVLFYLKKAKFKKENGF